MTGSNTHTPSVLNQALRKPLYDREKNSPTIGIVAKVDETKTATDVLCAA